MYLINTDEGGRWLGKSQNVSVDKLSWLGLLFFLILPRKSHKFADFPALSYLHSRVTMRKDVQYIFVALKAFGWPMKFAIYNVHYVRPLFVSFFF